MVQGVAPVAEGDLLHAQAVVAAADRAAGQTLWTSATMWRYRSSSRTAATSRTIPDRKYGRLNAATKKYTGAAE